MNWLFLHFHLLKKKKNDYAMEKKVFVMKLLNQLELNCSIEQHECKNYAFVISMSSEAVNREGMFIPKLLALITLKLDETSMISTEIQFHSATSD